MFRKYFFCSNPTSIMMTESIDFVFIEKVTTISRDWVFIWNAIDKNVKLESFSICPCIVHFVQNLKAILETLICKQCHLKRIPMNSIVLSHEIPYIPERLPFVHSFSVEIIFWMNIFNTIAISTSYTDISKSSIHRICMCAMQHHSSRHWKPAQESFCRNLSRTFWSGNGFSYRYGTVVHMYA